MSFNDNIDKFFIILNNLNKIASKSKPKNAITIFIFKNFNDYYTAYLGINETIVTNSFNKELVNEIARNTEEMLIKNKQTLFLNNLFPKVENITEKELNSILFAFSKIYDAFSLSFNNNYNSVIKIQNNFLAFASIEIYFSSSIISEEMLTQHSNGINLYNSIERKESVDIKKLALYNHQKGYRKFVDILDFFEIKSNKTSILSAYDCSIDKFEKIIRDNPNFIENNNEKRKQKKLNNITSLF